MVRLENDAQARRWHAGQMLRFLVESKAQAEGVNAYEARRGAELMVSAAGEADLRKRLAHLLSFWSAQSLEELFEDTRAQLLSQHPLLGRSDEHTSELQSLMRISYAVFCSKKKKS